MKKYKYYLIPPIIVMLILTIIYLINGVYPFGKNTILNGDFPSAYIPIYYYMWDLFRGNANLFINFKVGMGTCMYDLTSIYGILSPFSWIIALCKRSDIPYFMSILFMNFTLIYCSYSCNYSKCCKYNSKVLLRHSYFY